MSKRFEIQPRDTYPAISPEPKSLTPVAHEAALYAAEYEAFCDTLRAGLALRAMDNVAALCAKEEFYLQTAPRGAEDYRRFIEIYADTAASHLLDTDW